MKLENKFAINYKSSASVNTEYVEPAGKVNFEPVSRPKIKPLKVPKRGNFNIEKFKEIDKIC